jgi:fructose-1,6-bisphosphatase/inositol monophosphatase family enzyme
MVNEFKSLGRLNWRPQLSSHRLVHSHSFNCVGIYDEIPKQYQIPHAFFDTFPSRETRAFGSAALELSEVARGSADVFLLNGLCCWDIAASVLIVREAGGWVCDMHENGLDDPNQFDIFKGQCIAGASKAIVQELLAQFHAFKGRGSD